MNSFLSQAVYEKAVSILIVCITLLLVYDMSIAKRSTAVSKPKINQACIGTPIEVDYAYHGNMLAPHACAQQCNTNVQRYVLYTNGKATQCQTLPGCLDWGEDQGVTCIPKA